MKETLRMYEILIRHLLGNLSYGMFQEVKKIIFRVGGLRWNENIDFSNVSCYIKHGDSLKFVELK